jgi:hypothetical protein
MTLTDDVQTVRVKGPGRKGCCAADGPSDQSAIMIAVMMGPEAPNYLSLTQETVSEKPDERTDQICCACESL